MTKSTTDARLKSMLPGDEPERSTHVSRCGVVGDVTRRCNSARSLSLNTIGSAVHTVPKSYTRPNFRDTALEIERIPPGALEPLLEHRDLQLGIRCEALEKKSRKSSILETREPRRHRRHPVSMVQRFCQDESFRSISVQNREVGETDLVRMVRTCQRVRDTTAVGERQRRDVRQTGFHESVAVRDSLQRPRLSVEIRNFRQCLAGDW